MCKFLQFAFPLFNMLHPLTTPWTMGMVAVDPGSGGCFSAGGFPFKRGGGQLETLVCVVGGYSYWDCICVLVSPSLCPSEHANNHSIHIAQGRVSSSYASLGFPDF